MHILQAGSCTSCDALTSGVGENLSPLPSECRWQEFYRTAEATAMAGRTYLWVKLIWPYNLTCSSGILLETGGTSMLVWMDRG